MSLNTDVSGWRMNLYIPQEFDGNTEYQLNLALRVDWRKKPTSSSEKGQRGFKAFAYDEKTRGVLVERFLTLQELKSEEYVVFEIGTFSPKYKDRIVIAPFEKEFLNNYYIDFIELIPVKK